MKNIEDDLCYNIATVLDPRFKTGYFINPNKVKMAIYLLKQLMKKERNKDNTDASIDTISVAEDIDNDGGTKKLAIVPTLKLLNRVKIQTTRSQAVDTDAELEWYLKESKSQRDKKT